MSLIDECKLPDLSDLNTKQLMNLIMCTAFGGTDIEGKKCKLLVAHYVRVTDHTIREYNYAREALQEYTYSETSHMSPRYVALSHLEACLTSLERARKLLKTINRESECPQIPRNLGILKGSGNTVKNVRNNIQHLDDKIRLNKEVKKGGDIKWPWLKKESIELNEIEVSYSTLAKKIQEIHRVAKELAIPNEATE